MISGNGLTVEIGHRALLRDASFLVATGEKVGLVGRNGTGKSTLISVLVGETAPEVRTVGEVRTMGALGYLPQVPKPEGLGVDPLGFSHVLSGRGLDRLDEQVGRAIDAGLGVLAGCLPSLGSGKVADSAASAPLRHLLPAMPLIHRRRARSAPRSPRRRARAGERS